MSLITGNRMEDQALNFLKKQGFKLLKRNFRTRMGEIDLIMLDQEALVFIEVRYRQHHSHGNALESVDFFKQQKLTRAAQSFLQRHPHHQNQPCRFDVIAFSKDNNTPEWIRNAF